ncbi:MAG: FIST N-terminal domain-containing protein, partial [Methanosarcinales archaeon]
YQQMLDALAEEFGNIPQIGASVDGMIYPHDMRTDGAALVLCSDPDAKISVKGARENSATKSAKKLAEQIDCKNGVIILHFPLVHVPNVFKSLQFFARGFYYSRRCKGLDQNSQKEFARKFADYCDKEKIFYTQPTTLKIFAEHTKYKIPILGINVVHTQMKFNTPNIFCNFKDIEDGIAALTIEKDGIDVVYDDIFPDKGNTLEETMYIVRKTFTVVKEFKANFERNVLISLDDKPPFEAVKNIVGVFKESEEKLLNNLEKGDLQVQMPYILNFFNKKTNGRTHVGFGSYCPFDLFPFFIDISDYSERILFAYEPFYGRLHDFISSLSQLKSQDNFNFFCIDVASISAFGKEVYKLRHDIKNILKQNYFGLLTSAPSVFLPPVYQKRKYMSEIDDNIIYTSAGSNVCVSI